MARPLIQTFTSLLNSSAFQQKVIPRRPRAVLAGWTAPDGKRRHVVRNWDGRRKAQELPVSRDVIQKTNSYEPSGVIARKFVMLKHKGLQGEVG